MSKRIGFRIACGLLVIFMVVSVIGCARASFEVSNLAVEPAQSHVGEAVNVSLEVENTGSASGTHSAALTVNGETVEIKEITLPHGESEVVVFTFVKDAVGTYDIAVGSLSETLTVVKAAYELVPQDADFLFYLHFNKVLNDPDVRALYQYTYEAIPQELRPAEFPATVEDAVDTVRVETGLDLNDFSEVWMFADSASLMGGGEYVGLMAEGRFDGIELVEAIEKLAEVEFFPQEYKGYQIHINEQEDVAITFLREDMVVFGPVDVVRDVVDVETGDETPISGSLYDVYTSLPRVAISRYAIRMPEELRSEIREALTIPEIPIDLTPIAEIETMGEVITKDDQLIMGRSAVYFSDEASAHDFADMFEGSILLLKAMIDIPEVKALLGNIEITRADAQVIVEYQVSVDEIESLIDGIMEVVEEYAGLYPVRELTVGNKNFTEEYIIGELMKQLLEDRGFKVNLVSNLSTMALREGMETGDIDVCADYTGTAWMVFLQHGYEPGVDNNEVYELVKEEEEGKGFIWLNPIWNNNTYALASWPEFAEDNDVETLSDLAALYGEREGEIETFVDFQFSARPDGLSALESYYDFEVAEAFLMTGSPGGSLLALENHDCDVALVFGTDAFIATHGWHLYTDDRSFFPPYDLAPYVREEVLDEFPEIEGILDELVATFPGGGEAATPEIVSECRGVWQELNAKVDIDMMEPREVAYDYLVQHGLITE